MSSQADKERVREANDIVEVVSGYVALKNSGKNFKGLCPFHKEKTPSFMVSPDRQSFKCFGCGVGGDVFEFLMRVDGLTFPEAMQQLAIRGRVELTPYQKSEDTEADRLQRKLYPVMAWAVERFQKGLASSEVGSEARVYFEKRKLTPALIEKFGLGFAPAGWDNILRAGARDHYSREILEQAGLLISKEGTDKVYDRFRTRVMFPIFDLQGRPVAFGGRLLVPGEPKYLNSPETPVFHKGELLYALNFARDRARENKRLILTEGYMDVIACHGADVTETVASLGTSLTTQQAKLIKRYVNRVILLYDMDAAGLQASIRAFENLNQVGVQVRVAELPDAKDPDEFIHTQGVEAFQFQLDNTLSIVEFVLNAACQRHVLDSVDGKLAVLGEVGPLIFQFPKNGVERGEYIHLVAERLRLLDSQVIVELERLGNAAPVFRGKQEKNEKTQIHGLARTCKAIEEVLISILLQFPMEIEAFREVLRPESFAVAEYRELMEKILAAEPVDPDDEELWFPSVSEHWPLDISELAKRLSAMDRGTEEPERVVRDCLNRLQVMELQGQLNEIQIRIKEAEKNGDMETWKQRAQEKIELAARIKQFGVIWK
ncbi:DNA primase [bacterium]|nr:DNA primase [bacterium]